MHVMQWLRIFNELKYEEINDKDTLVAKIKEKLMLTDLSTYTNWEENHFDIDHAFRYDGNEVLPLHYTLTEICTINCHENFVILLINDVCYSQLRTETSLPYGSTLLHIAVCKGNLPLVQYLVDKRKHHVEATDVNGRSPIHLATNLDVAKYLIDNGSNLEATDKYNWTPLHHAIEKNHIDIVRYMVDEKKASLTAASSHGWDALHFTAVFGRMSILKYLIKEKEANKAMVDSRGRTLLHNAAFGGDANIETVLHLIEELQLDITAVDDRGKTPLHIAVLSNANDIIRYLIDEKGVDTAVRDAQGKTILHYAVLQSNLDLVRYLIEDKLADVTAADKKGRTILHNAMFRMGNINVVKYLVEYMNIDLAVVDEIGRTPLHWAVLFGGIDIVRYLVNAKSDLTLGDRYGMTPLGIARITNDSAVAEYIMGMCKTGGWKEKTSREDVKNCVHKKYKRKRH